MGHIWTNCIPDLSDIQMVTVLTEVQFSNGKYKMASKIPCYLKSRLKVRGFPLKRKTFLQNIQKFFWKRCFLKTAFFEDVRKRRSTILNICTAFCTFLKSLWKKPTICYTGLETGCKPVLLTIMYHNILNGGDPLCTILKLLNYATVIFPRRQKVLPLTTLIGFVTL